MCSFVSRATAPRLAEFVTVRTVAGEIAGDGCFELVPAPSWGADAPWICWVLTVIFQMPHADNFYFINAGRPLQPGVAVVEDSEGSLHAEVTMAEPRAAHQVLLGSHCAREGGSQPTEQASGGSISFIGGPGSSSQDSCVEVALTDFSTDTSDDFDEIPEEYLQASRQRREAGVQTDLTIPPADNLDLVNLESDCVDVGTQAGGWIKRVVRQRQLGRDSESDEEDEVDEEVTVAWHVANTSRAPSLGAMMSSSLGAPMP